MRFTYRARNKRGKLQTGVVDASSYQAALDVLHRNRLTTFYLAEDKGGISLLNDIKFSGVKGKDLVAFFRSFSSLFEAGVPLVEGFYILADQTENNYFRTIILELADDVDGGMKLSQAMGRYPDAFSDFFVNMVKAGETSGALEKTLAHLAEYTEREYQLRASIRNALIYPVFIIVVFVAVFLTMMVFVVPRLTQVFLQIGGTDRLPFLTRMLISVSQFTGQWILAILILLGGGVGAGGYYLRLPQGKEWWSRLQLRLPFFKKIFKQIYQTRLADNLAMLVRGGIPIIEALEICADVVGNRVYAKLIRKIGEEVKAGNTIESVVETREEFSPYLVEMIAVGERSGKLDKVLQKVADFYQKDNDRAITALTTLIEPLLIIVLGAGVGLLVAGIIIPIYTVVSNVGG